MGSSTLSIKNKIKRKSIDGLIPRNHSDPARPASADSTVVHVELRRYHAEAATAANTKNAAVTLHRFAFPVSNLWFLITVLVAVQLFQAHVTQAESKGHSFSNHVVIRPELHNARLQKSLETTLDEESGLHVPHITLSYHHLGQRITADLHLNEQLIPIGHFLRYQDTAHGNGDIVQNFTKTDIDLCHYQGVVRDKPESKVAVSTCGGGVNGVVHDGKDTYFIHSGEDGRIQDDHFLFKHTDIVQNATCGHNSEENHIRETNERPRNWDDIQNRIYGSELNRMLRYKRSNSIENNIIRGPFNANKHSSFVELVIVVDNKVYKSFGEDMKKVHRYCKDLANIVNALIEPLNIFIALVGVVVWNESNEIKFSKDSSVTLTNFKHYRRDKLAMNHPNDNAHLLILDRFDGSVVGKAYKGKICDYGYSCGVSVKHSEILAVVAATMAHEMGHNLGMDHDTENCRCPGEKCIMSGSSTSVVPHYWSSCSIKQQKDAFSHDMYQCLRNKPTKLFDSPQCGNGFVEPGEQCDCGLAKYCKNSCCNPKTCMLRVNASCATGECCDLSTCRLKTAGTNCRPSENECDLPEYCTGKLEYCPTNVFKRDTEPCDGGNAYCYQGTCSSRNNQCRFLWGPSGESVDDCYERNQQGDMYGNCGFDPINEKYLQCEREDIFCGMLHCSRLNKEPKFMEQYKILHNYAFSPNFTVMNCTVLITYMPEDPGLTPNGAKCGENKMCVDQKCIVFEDLRSKSIGVECRENCSGNGICNSKGNCHCNEGYAPPFCNAPGAGGSEDSGPATNPNSLEGFTSYKLIFFLCVVPVLVILALIIYYCRNNPQIPRKLVKNSLFSIRSTPSSSEKTIKSTTVPSSASSTSRQITTKTSLQETDNKLSPPSNPHEVCKSTTFVEDLNKFAFQLKKTGINLT